MRELFIYYRVRTAGEASARQAVQVFQARLCERHPGLRARLLRRPADTESPAGDGLQTWMEIYATEPMQQPDGVSPELQAMIERDAVEALADHLAGPRHTEVFIPCA